MNSTFEGMDMELAYTSNFADKTPIDNCQYTRTGKFQPRALKNL